MPRLPVSTTAFLTDLSQPPVFFSLNQEEVIYCSQSTSDFERNASYAGKLVMA